MTTMNDIVTGALKRLRIINPRETADATIVAEGLDTLNQLMHSWKGRGVDTRHSDLELTDDFPLDEEHIQGVMAMLAVRLAGTNGVDADEGIVIDASNGWSNLLAEFVQPVDTVFDTPLLRTGRLFQ